MNKISGRVVLKETGAGIPDLLVVVFDVDPDTRPEEQIPTTPASASLPFLQGDGDRIGGVLTKASGEFELTFEDAEFQIRSAQEKRPDLLLSVWAPEEPGVDPVTRLLYTSNALRQNAGRTEEYLVRLSADALKKAGLNLPSSVPREAEPATGVLTRSAENAERVSNISDGSIQIAQQRMDLHRTRFAGFEAKLKPALADALSKLPDSPIASDRVVRAGESPFEKGKATIVTGIREVVNSDDPAKRAPRRGYLSLTPDDVDELKAQAAPDGTVSEDAVKAIAKRNGQSSQTTYVEALDRLPLCLPRSVGSDCATPLLDPPVTSPEPGPETPPGEEPADTIGPEDIPRYLARLMEPLTAPEDQLLTGITPSATRESVSSSVRKLLFPPGPADAPAFHDFNTLQIAFDYVWQEAIDQGVLDIAQDAYETIVELGGDPTRPEYGTHGPLSAILAEGRATLKASRPIVVRDHRGESSTPPPRDRNGASGDTCGASGGLVVRDHRTGWLPITTWSPTSTASDDPTERLPQLLQDLERRLLQNYNFTVYAANSKERSVNFGILNTYRQIWTPLSYQAGSLIKSIPLAPKQSQKVVVNRKTTRKRARKELEHNLQVTKEETSQTSRTEQEIARRAQTKTDFSVENTAGENTGVNNASTTIKMSHEASKSSDDIKKAMHENTFKAAQECRRELTTEVTTEETEEADYSETTEISNPNDEIAVTYLFYELQRRYRLFERLYRVRPVVLVAQEFPQPHEINQAWLVAHDWILKRVILDDSFLPTLNTLSQSAGDETAIAELRQNVDQQRCIVRQLREELVIANQRAALQRQLLERSVLQRAGATSKGGGGGLFGIVEDAAGALGGVADKVGDFIFGGGGGGDAESNRQAMQERAQEAADQAREILYRLEREVTALNALTETFAKALREHHTHLTEIARLENHVRDNIFKYMHDVWTFEPPDQRYFRLHNVPVPVFHATSRAYKIDFDAPLETGPEPPHKTLPRFGGKDVRSFAYESHTKIGDQIELAPLSQVADLDTLLGFKGNYMIFPLLESNALTDFMMDPFVDRATGQLVDPSDPLNWSIDEFTQYACCLKEKLTADELAEILPTLKAMYKAILSNPLRKDDVLVVPTSSLFIEMLLGENAAIEKFKAAHRAIDVLDAREKVRAQGLESVRRAARILAEEREDPNIDHRVLIQGEVQGVVVPTPDH